MADLLGQQLRNAAANDAMRGMLKPSPAFYARRAAIASTMTQEKSQETGPQVFEHRSHAVQRDDRSRADRENLCPLLLATGVHPKVVQERLGHSQIGITLDTYSHVVPTLQLEAATKLDGLMRPSRNRTAASSIV